MLLLLVEIIIWGGRKVKQFAIALLVALITVLAVMPPPAHAQGFLVGLAAGALFFGGNGTEVSGVNGAIIYVVPRVSERVKDPLGVKFASVYMKSYDAGMTLYSMFTSLQKNPDDYVILQVVRLFDGQHIQNAAFWFAYAPKKDVIPEELLPSTHLSSSPPVPLGPPIPCPAPPPSPMSEWPSPPHFMMK